MIPLVGSLKQRLIPLVFEHVFIYKGEHWLLCIYKEVVIRFSLGQLISFSRYLLFFHLYLGSFAAAVDVIVVLSPV